MEDYPAALTDDADERDDASRLRPQGQGDDVRELHAANVNKLGTNESSDQRSSGVKAAVNA